jgi:hypothetical protein
MVSIGLDSVLGTLDQIRVEGSEIVGTIRLSSRREIAPIVEDVRIGVISHFSAGYEVQQWQDGTNAQGQRTRTATRWITAAALSGDVVGKVWLNGISR